MRRAFEELVEFPDRERAERLGELRARDPELAADVESLLAIDAEGTDYLALGAAHVAPELVAEALAPGPNATPGAMVGPYRLRALLGCGGMGEVWEADRADGQFEQTVALKLIRLGMDSAQIERRFLRERQILARLEHPHIARLLDGGLTAGGRPYFVLEKVEGLPITRWAAERSSSVRVRVELMIGVAEAVAAAHRSLVVHRDLKPSNILVGDRGQVKLLDFGIAKVLSPDFGPDAGAPTQLEDRALTPAYAAPEQILDQPITTATDVYALGVVLYELLTGRLPHERSTASLAALVRGVEQEAPSRPSRAIGQGAAGVSRRALEGDLDLIVLKALAREPERRYGGAAELADDLRRYVEGLPVEARPDRFGYRAAKFVRRHRIAVVLSALAAVGLTSLAVVALVQGARAERAALVARSEAARAERVRAYLVSVFAAAEPSRTLGAKIEARSLVDEGVRRVDAELEGEPELHAEMLDLFAGLYRQLGELDAGLAIARRSYDDRRARLGDEDPATAKSEWTLGWILSNRGDFAVARGHLEHAIGVLDSREGPQSLAAADAREPLMELLFASEGPLATLAVVERRLATYRSVLGESDVRTALALSDLAVVEHQLGRNEAAEVGYRTSAAILAEVAADNDPRAAYPHANLAALLRESGRVEEAEREARLAYSIRRTALGPAHPETALTLSFLGRVLIERGNLEEGEAAVREALGHLEGRDTFGASTARENLAAMLLASGRPAEALQQAERVVAERAEMLPEEHILSLSARLLRAKVLAEIGRLEEARSELAAVLPALERQGDAAGSLAEAARQLVAKLGESAPAGERK